VSVIPLRLRHALTFYHLRANRSPSSKLAICSCGWRCWPFRKTRWKTRVRSLVCAVHFGHVWDEPSPVMVGPVGFEATLESIVGLHKQCERCWTVVEVSVDDAVEQWVDEHTGQPGYWQQIRVGDEMADHWRQLWLDHVTEDD
jgi:hypothetical protein